MTMFTSVTVLIMATKLSNISVDNSDKTIAVNVQLPAELHRRVKIAAVQRGISIKAAVVEALDDWAPK